MNTRHDLFTVAVVGLGKIGLPLAVQYALHGWHVTGCDIDTSVVTAINAGQSSVQEEPELASELPRLVREGLLAATTNTTEAVRQAAAVVVIVPVIVDEQHAVNFHALDAATEAVGTGLQAGTLVLYETTLPVGTTSRRIARMLERTSGLVPGQDFFLAHSPERVSSGSIFLDLRRYPKVVGGVDEQSTAAAVRFYQSVLDADIITMASSEEAEFVKLIETTYRDVNIALANEFACFADDQGLNVASAIAAANTQPYSHIHSPGVGVGGHCIPVYPYFLLAGLEEQGGRETAGGLSPLTLPRSARRINDSMATYAVRRLAALLGGLERRAVLILGVAYRADVSAVAFSSAHLLQQALLTSGATVYADDPFLSASELHHLGYEPLVPEREGEIEAIVLQAGHKVYQSWDFSRFPRCRAVLDGRNALQRQNVEALGIHYISIGGGNL